MQERFYALKAGENTVTGRDQSEGRPFGPKRAMDSVSTTRYSEINYTTKSLPCTKKHVAHNGIEIVNDKSVLDKNHRIKKR